MEASTLSRACVHGVVVGGAVVMPLSCIVLDVKFLALLVSIHCGSMKGKGKDR